MNLKQKLSHFWDYYKWHTLIALFFAAVFFVLIVQMATREEHDIRIIYAGPAIIYDSQSAGICSAAQQIMPLDYDGDGEKRAALNHLIIMNEEELNKLLSDEQSPYTLNAQKINENRQTLTSYAYAGDFLIFMLSEECYAPLAEANAFVPLDSIGVTEGKRYDDSAVYLNSLDVSKFYADLGKLPEDTLVCLRRVRITSEGDSKQEKMFEHHKEFFKAFTDFKLPEGFEP